MYATVQSPDRDYIVRSRRGGENFSLEFIPNLFEGLEE